MGPERTKDGWEYAGEADTKTWHTWKDWELPEKTREFHYRDGDNIGRKADEFPEVGYQENPEKM